MRISFVNQSAIRGGQEVYLEQLAGWMIRVGHEVTIYGGPSTFMDLRNGKMQAGGLIEYIPDVPRTWAAYKRLEKQSDIIVLNGNRALYLWGMFLIFSRMPTYYIQHSLFSEPLAPYWRRLIRRILFYLLLPKLTGVIRICEASLPSFRFIKNKLFTVYAGVDLPKTALTDAGAGVGPKRFRVAMVGRVDNNKGQERAIRAIANLGNVELFFAGDGPEVHRLMRLSEDLGLQERVHFLGYLQDLDGLYERINLLLILSKTEGVPLVALEAMSWSIPVIATSVGGLPELIEHTHNGFLLGEDPSIADVAGIMSDVMDGLYDLESIRNNARKTISMKFDRSRNFSILEKILTENFLRNNS